MKRVLLLPLLLLAAFCSSSGGAPGQVSAPGHGAIQVTITPNPIVAKSVGGTAYEFPFEVVVRETGGRDVMIDRVTADVFAFNALRVGSETYDASKIQSMGFSTRIPANGELRYRFNPRRDVTDDRAFGALSADVHVDAHDDTSAATNANTSVTITR